MDIREKSEPALCTEMFVVGGMKDVGVVGVGVGDEDEARKKDKGKERKGLNEERQGQRRRGNTK